MGNQIASSTSGVHVSIEVIDRIEFFLSRQIPARSSQVAPGLSLGTLRGPRAENQDRAVVARLSLPSGESFIIAVVCDGMGGMAQGGEAATCAASTFIGRFASSSKRTPKAHLYDAVSAANLEVFSRFNGNGGTTLTAIVVMNTGESWVVHVGDSRLYECRFQDGLSLLTRDDTIGGQLRPTVDQDNLDNRLLQFVGLGAQIEPHIFRIPQLAGATYLLTSDGAHSIGRKAMEGIVRHSSTTAELVRKAIFVAEAIGVEDNSSAISIAFDELEPLPAFSSGTELTIWSPSDKLEMWIAGVSVQSVENDQGKRQRSSDAPRSKKANRQQAKSVAKVGPLPEDQTSEVNKPQLNIEFGNGTKDQR